MDHDTDPSEGTEQEIEELLKAVENMEVKPKMEKRPVSIQQQRHSSKNLSDVISQYCDCFLLFGFDFNGNPCIIVNSDTNMQSRALGDLLNDFMEQSNVHFIMGEEEEEESDDDEEEEEE